VSATAKVIPVHERRPHLARDIARAILDGFDKHYRLFREVSVQARGLFERAAWEEMRRLARNRIQMYDLRVQEAVEALLDRYPEAELDESLWPAIKLAYIGLLHDHSQPECAETFYNSVACQVLHRRHYHNEFIFWRPAVATEHLEGEAPTYRCYYPLRTGLRATLREIATGFGLANPWEDLHRDLLSVVRALRAHFQRPVRVRPDLQIQVLGSLFFRNKAAYIVGRVITRSASCLSPCRFCRTSAASCTWTRCWSEKASSWCCSRSRAPTSLSTWTCPRLTCRSCAG